MSPMERRLAAALAAAWEAEVTAAQRMAALAERVLAPPLRSRLLVLSAFSRAHACRLLARLSTNGRGPLPVPAPDDEPPPGPVEALVEEARRAKDAASRYRAAADVARGLGDLSSAWVCELNGTEELDRATQLLAMSRELEQADHGDSFAV